VKIKDVQLSILRTELDETVIPTQGAVDKLPQLVLVTVSTDEGIDGHYVSYLIPAKSVEHAAEVAKTILVGRDTYDVGALSHEMTNALPPYSNPPALAAADACLWISTPKRLISPCTNTLAPSGKRFGRMPAPLPTPPSTATSTRSAVPLQRVSLR